MTAFMRLKKSEELWQHNSVAQICNLLYRRFAIGRVSELTSERDNLRRQAGSKPAIQQIANLRYNGGECLSGVHCCFGEVCLTASHVTSAAPPQMTAPMAIVRGTPSQCDNVPASSPPIGIMPPKTSAQMPITRPR